MRGSAHQTSSICRESKRHKDACCQAMSEGVKFIAHQCTRVRREPTDIDIRWEREEGA